MIPVKNKIKQGLKVEHVSFSKEGCKRTVEAAVALWVVELFTRLELHVKNLPFVIQPNHVPDLGSLITCPCVLSVYKAKQCRRILKQSRCMYKKQTEIF